MKSSTKPGASIPVFFALFLALLLGGCLDERLAWSPDGRHAAVVTADGLYLADASGAISPLLLPGVYRAAWLADSRQLVLARRQVVKSFAEVSVALGPERTRLLAAKAESLAQQLRDLPPREKVSDRIGDEIGEDLAGILAYFRERPELQALLREKLGQEWREEADSKPLVLHELLVARREGSSVVAGAILHRSLPGVRSILPAPGGRAVAFTQRAELGPRSDGGIRLLLVPCDASAPARVVATQSSTHPSWSADGRRLVYFQATGHAGRADELRLGSLVTHAVLDASGRILPVDGPTELARVAFRSHSRIHCLNDGRLLFNAPSFSVPNLAVDRDERDQLFILRPGPAGILTSVVPPAHLEQLPESLAVFSVSPDQSQILIGSDDGAVWLVGLAAGGVEAIGNKVESDPKKGEGNNFPAASWRAAGEFTYLRKSAPGVPGELIQRLGTGESVLCRNWDPSLLRRLIE